MFLPEEDQEKIVETIEQDKNGEVVESTERWHQEFFRSGSKVGNYHTLTSFTCINYYLHRV